MKIMKCMDIVWHVSEEDAKYCGKRPASEKLREQFFSEAVGVGVGLHLTGFEKSSRIPLRRLGVEKLREHFSSEAVRVLPHPF